MRHTIVICCLVLTTLALVAGAAPTSASPTQPQKNCPVTGEPIDKSAHLDFQGQRIYFCCPNCFAQFRNDPEKYFAKFEKEGIALENIQMTCPVSGEQLGEGDMGKPVSIAYKGRTVQFCCGSCIKKFQAEPAKYLAKLPGEQPAAK